MVPIGAQTAEAIGDPIAARACAPVRTHPYAWTDDKMTVCVSGKCVCAPFSASTSSLGVRRTRLLWDATSSGVDWTPKSWQ